jgi:hypothetical protein
MINTDTSVHALAHASVTGMSLTSSLPVSALRTSSRLNVSVAMRPSISSEASLSAGRLMMES